MSRILEKADEGKVCPLLFESNNLRVKEKSQISGEFFVWLCLDTKWSGSVMLDVT
jgi:hypothetical protein